MIDLRKLVNVSYLFERRPNPDSDLILILAILFAVLLLASGVTWLIYVRRERTAPYLQMVREKLTNYLFTSGFVGLLLLFFRWQAIPYFASRIWLLLWLGIVVVWGFFLSRTLLKKIPEERRVFEERQLREKYLPKSRNRRTVL